MGGEECAGGGPGQLFWSGEGSFGGGAGTVGGVVLPLLAASPVLDLIVVTDRDLAVCETRVSALDGGVAETVDAEQAASVAQLIKRHEIELIVNVAGPYSATLMPVDEAVIEFFENVGDQREQLAPPSDFPPAEVWVDVEGTMDGRPIRVTSWASEPLPTTSRILAAAVNGIVSRQIDEPRVHTAEALSTKTFLSLIADESGADTNTLIAHRITPIV